ncbi:MAG: tRNA (adenosine(37)-N6)-threonylcarbamoyltransferase complex ATPase subunit type 1 TsaE [Rudaea sp.]
MSTRVPVGRLDEPRLVELAHRLAGAIGAGGVIHLRGDLGAGKTTFARALLRSLGVGERIKSPTYSLIESYAAGPLAVHHLDLYRIADAGELEWLGLPDLTVGAHLLAIEWPERAGAALPSADLVVHLAHAGAAREMWLEPLSAQGRRWAAVLAAASDARGSAGVNAQP